MNIKDYWTSPSNIRFIDKKGDEDYNEAEEEDVYCDELGHVPASLRHKHTHCIYCGLELTKKRINSETVYVDPTELEKLKQWNEMTGKRGGEG